MKVTPVKGTNDYLPKEVEIRDYLQQKILEVYLANGFEHIITPVIEDIENLDKSDGGENLNLIFKIMKRGDKLDKALASGVTSENENVLADMGLRYDLTLPLSRYYANNKDKLTLPMKCIQMDRVYRAERPQKGRLREFIQCDIDIIGSESNDSEIELILTTTKALQAIGMKNFKVKLNDRRLLRAVLMQMGFAENELDSVCITFDKLDKIGLDNVNAELKEKGISDEAIAKLQPIILLSGTNAEKLATLKNVLAASEVGLKGVEESEFILNTLETMGLKNEIELDLTLARGLNYYTGAIFEVKALDVQIGSITGGGRYDNLTGVFGMAGVSGVGISFGADRIFDVLNQLDLYPKEAVNGTELLFVNFGDKEAAYCLPILAKVREAGVRAEIYPDASKMKKQMGYANDKQIPFVAIVGENEMNEGKLTLKNMTTGEQSLVTPDELLAVVKA